MKTYNGSFLTEDFDKHMRDVWKVDSFDLTIQNPPFMRKTNLKFLEKSMKISEMSIFVHPSSWLIDEKNSNSDFKKARDTHSSSLEEVILFNGNKTFNIGLYIPSAITVINKNKKDSLIKVVDQINQVEIVYDNINDINKFSNLKEYKTILYKTKNTQKLSDFYNKDNKKYYVNMSRIRGNVHKNSDTNLMHCDDFYTTVTKDEKVELKVTKSVYFTFNSFLEADNFLKYLKTNFSRFCLSVCKNSADLNKIDFSVIPWLDFTQEWTDEKLYQYFNLTENEVKFIEKHIPKYY
jgi:hypothetical protein